METSTFLERNAASAAPVVCMGSDWYTFPSHFLLPPSARLEYFKDGFGGILPQHFAPEGGTWRPPLQPFNGLNREETSRYVGMDACDYVVRLMTSDAEREAVAAAGRQQEPTYEWTRDGVAFDKVLAQRIIDSGRSSPLTRALALPGMPEKNQYFEYALLRAKK
jgi:alpha-1,2-mannosyltransferase